MEWVKGWSGSKEWVKGEWVKGMDSALRLSSSCVSAQWRAWRPAAAGVRAFFMSPHSAGQRPGPVQSSMIWRMGLSSLWP